MGFMLDITGRYCKGKLWKRLISKKMTDFLAVVSWDCDVPRTSSHFTRALVDSSVYIAYAVQD